MVCATPGRGRPMAAPTPSETVPLAVWPCAQVPIRRQWADAGYAPGTAALAGALLPDLAQRIIACYSSPGDLVIEPVAGAGVIAVEAARLRRRAIAVSPTPAMACLVSDNARRVLANRERPEPEMVTGDAETIVEAIPRRICAAALVALSLPRRRLDDGGLRWDVPAVLRGCRALLTAGGLLVVVSRAGYVGRRFVSDATATVRAAEQVGLDYFQHIIALTATVRGGELVAMGRALTRGDRHVITHTDVLVFRKRRVAADD